MNTMNDISIRTLEPGVAHPASEPPTLLKTPEHLLPATPLKEVKFGSLFDPRLRMRHPITLTIEKNGDTYVATYDELEEYGCGDNPLSAVDAFRQALSITYWSLKVEQDHLGPHLANIWRRLSELVYEA